MSAGRAVLGQSCVSVLTATVGFALEDELAVVRFVLDDELAAAASVDLLGDRELCRDGRSVAVTTSVGDAGQASSSLGSSFTVGRGG